MPRKLSTLNSMKMRELANFGDQIKVGWLPPPVLLPLPALAHFSHTHTSPLHSPHMPPTP